MICIRCEQEIEGEPCDAQNFEEHLSAEDPDGNVFECEEGDKLCMPCVLQLLEQGKNYGCSQG